MTMSELSDHDRFQHWLMAMDDALEAFFAALPQEMRQQLDSSLESLDVIEARLISLHSTVDNARSQGDPVFFDGCARYVGETLRRQIGGKWEIVLDDPSNVHYRKPRLAGFRNRMPPVCPIQWLFTVVSRRKGDFMRKIVLNYGLG